MEVQLTEVLFFLLGDAVQFGAHLVQAPLEGGVVDGHGLNAVTVDLCSGTLAGQDSVWGWGDEVDGDGLRPDEVFSA